MPIGTIASIAGIASAGVGIAGAAGAFGGGGDFSTAPRDLYKEYTDVINAQAATAPKALALHQQYDPAYARNNFETLKTLLSGSPGGTQEVQYQDYERRPIYAPTPAGYNPRTGPGWGADGKPLPTPGSITGYQQVPVVRKKTVDTPASEGLLKYFENTLQPAASRIEAQGNTASRTADIADVANLSPAMREAIRAGNPEAAALLDKLTSQANTDLDLGAELNPSEARNLAQGTRAGQAARGMGLGPQDAFAEALASLNYGRGLEADRRSTASGVIGQSQSFYGDPLMAILGRASGAQPQAFLGQAGNITASSGAPNFGETAYAADLFNTNFNAGQAQAIAGRNRTAGIGAGALNSSGSIFGNLLKYMQPAGGGGSGDAAWNNAGWANAQY